MLQLFPRFEEALLRVWNVLALMVPVSLSWWLLCDCCWKLRWKYFVGVQQFFFFLLSSVEIRGLHPAHPDQHWFAHLERHYLFMDFFWLLPQWSPLTSRSCAQRLPPCIWIWPVICLAWALFRECFTSLNECKPFSDWMRQRGGVVMSYSPPRPIRERYALTSCVQNAANSFLEWNLEVCNDHWSGLMFSEFQLPEASSRYDICIVVLDQVEPM